MTADAFRAALADLGLTQAAFARLLADHGHPAKDVARSVRRWAKIGPPGEVVVILSMAGNQLKPPAPETGATPEMLVAVWRRLRERAHDAMLLGIARADILLLNDQVEVVLVRRETSLAPAACGTEVH